MNIFLRKLSLEDTLNIVKWRNSSSVRKKLYSQRELTPEQHINYFHSVVEIGKCAQYIIVIDESGYQKDIGTVFIKNIDYQNKKGEFGIFIGEEDARGKGYASIATNQMLNIAFEELQLNRVYLTVMADNIPAVRAYKNVGFEVEGVLKEDYIRDGKPIDVILMAILNNKWPRRKGENG